MGALTLVLNLACDRSPGMDDPSSDPSTQEEENPWPSAEGDTPFASLPPCDGEWTTQKARGEWGELLEDIQPGLHACIRVDDDHPNYENMLYYRTAAIECPELIEGTDNCASDADCEADESCLCAGFLTADIDDGFWADYLDDEPRQFVSTNQCVRVYCPDDCGGLGCAYHTGGCGTTAPGLRCHTERDECGGAKGFCPEDSPRCEYNDGEERWVCGGGFDCE